MIITDWLKRNESNLRNVVDIAGTQNEKRLNNNISQFLIW
jgi:hypothetical protein